jgi:enoyl-CoA hydratase/carnithine racemase
MPSVVDLELRERIALLRLNRPEVHNAVDERVMEGLEGHLTTIQARHEIATIVLSGAGRDTFCSGGDLRYFASLPTREQGLAMSQRMQAILDRLYTGDRVVLAAVNGTALGGGCEILTACHLRIASAEASFSFRQARNGVVTGWGGGVRLFRLLGRGAALRLLLTSETLSSKEALRMGLVDLVVPPDEVLPTCIEMATRIAECSEGAVSGFLRLVRCLEEKGATAARELETELFGDTWVSPEFKAILARYTR